MGGRVRGFGELEAVIMDRLWTWGGTATVRDVVDSLQPDRNSAYTTIMTVMDNLYHKGSLTRERDGRAWRYQPTLTREEYSAHLMREALDTSPATDMVFTHFVEHMTDEESQTLRAALRRLSRKRRT
jgi:predicted transcriptional regulator